MNVCIYIYIHTHTHIYLCMPLELLKLLSLYSMTQISGITDFGDHRFRGSPFNKHKIH